MSGRDRRDFRRDGGGNRDFRGGGDRYDRGNRSGGGDRYDRRGGDRHDRGGGSGHENYRAGGEDEAKDRGRSKIDRNPNPRSLADRSRSRERKERERRRDKEQRDDDREDSPVPTVKRRRQSGWDLMLPMPEDEVAPILAPGNPFQNPQLIRQQKKLYVGNLPPTMTEIELLEFFNSAMLNSNHAIGGGSPVTTASINHDKAYAFIEFRSMEEATAAMNLDGITYRGQPIRVRRPKDYAPLPEGSDQPASASLSIVSTNVADTPYKIFIGGLPPHLNEGDIKKLLSMFGQLKSFNLVRDSLTGLSKGFAFCEYLDTNITDTACASLNGMAIGDKNLIVQRASANTKKPDGTVITINPRAANMLTLSTPAAQLLATAVKNATADPTRILVIMNIVSLADFPGDHEDHEFDEFLEDIRQECERYGKVLKMVVPRPNKKNFNHTIERFDAMNWDDIDKSDDEEEEKEKVPDIPDPPALGRIFIEYEHVEQAKHAQTALSGRRYDGRMVVTSFHPEDKWTQECLEPDDMEPMSFPVFPPKGTPILPPVVEGS